LSSHTEYFLSTGEFARLCNTTKDTLRHYHDIGLLIPQKNAENGYYYYSVAQMTTFYFINVFRQLDTPLANIQDCMSDSDPVNYYNFCRKQVNSLEKLRYELDKKITALNNATMLMRHMNRIPDGEPHIFTFYEKTTYYATDITSKNSHHASDIVSDLQRHIINCKSRPDIIPFPVSATIDYNDFCNGRYLYKQICSSINAPVNGVDIFQMPTKRVIGCSCSDSSSNIVEHYQHLHQYIIDNKITVLSDLFSISLFNFVDEQEEHRYLKYIFFCIQE